MAKRIVLKQDVKNSLLGSQLMLAKIAEEPDSFGKKRGVQSVIRLIKTNSPKMVEYQSLILIQSLLKTKSISSLIEEINV